jgi:hypothetical protein
MSGSVAGAGVLAGDFFAAIDPGFFIDFGFAGFFRRAAGRVARLGARFARDFFFVAPDFAFLRFLVLAMNCLLV